MRYQIRISKKKFRIAAFMYEHHARQFLIDNGQYYSDMFIQDSLTKEKTVFNSDTNLFEKI